MTILLVDRVSPSLRGELSRWLLEPKVGVFVGKPSEAVRERLWKRVCKEVTGTAGCLLITPDTSEQGYRIASHGNPTRTVLDFDGLQLVKTLFLREFPDISPRARG